MAYTWDPFQVLPAIQISGTDTKTTGASTSAVGRMPSGWTPTTFTNGTGAGAANKAHYGVLTLSGSATTVDLTSMSFGIGDASLSKVKGMLIQNLTTTTSYKVTVGNAASAVFQFMNISATTTTVEVQPGCAFLYFDTTANGTTTTSHNNLKLDPGANTVSVFLAVWGE